MALGDILGWPAGGAWAGPWRGITGTCWKMPHSLWGLLEGQVFKGTTASGAWEGQLPLPAHSWPLPGTSQWSVLTVPGEVCGRLQMPPGAGTRPLHAWLQTRCSARVSPTSWPSCRSRPPAALGHT